MFTLEIEDCIENLNSQLVQLTLLDSRIQKIVSAALTCSRINNVKYFFLLSGFFSHTIEQFATSFKSSRIRTYFCTFHGSVHKLQN